MAALPAWSHRLKFPERIPSTLFGGDHMNPKIGGGGGVFRSQENRKP